MKNETKKSAEKVVKQPKPKLMNIKIEKLHPFENHPYKVLDDEPMTELVESIKEYGLLNRVIVRPIENNTEEYEIISGHRRVHAAEILEMKEVPAVVHLMEKARSYRMKADALSHQGKSLGQNVPKSEDNRTTAKIGNEAGDSYKTVQRLIRLTYLVPELQEYVDKGKMKMLPAYELSFLDEDAQRDIVDNIDETESFPSHAQARRMRAAFEKGKLDYDTVTEIMAEIKPNQVEKLKIPMDDIRKYVPSSMTPAEMLEYLLKLVKKEYDRQHNRDAR